MSTIESHIKSRYPGLGIDEATTKVSDLTDQAAREFPDPEVTSGVASPHLLLGLVRSQSPATTYLFEYFNITEKAVKKGIDQFSTPNTAAAGEPRVPSKALEAALFLLYKELRMMLNIPLS